MGAGVRTATNVLRTVLDTGDVLSINTVTTTDVDDWVVMSGMELTKFAYTFTTADGTNQEAYLDGTDNKVYFNVAGICTFIVLGSSVKSTGGAT